MSEHLDPNPELKQQVKSHWEAETCGIRYGEGKENSAFFDEITRTRYELEPYIADLADFESSKAKQVLEIGVGAGTDFIHWCRNADQATGIDLTDRAIELTRRRLELSNIPERVYSLKRMDSEKLEFASNSFDIVYSYGVIHHSPNTPAALAEIFRVLRPGGVFRGMVYHVYSWTTLMLWAQHGLLKGKPFRGPREILFHHLESPGTKAYTVKEAEQLLERTGFVENRVWTQLGPGDLLTIKPSSKYQGRLFKTVWRFYPRGLVRMLGNRFGLGLMIVAKKPDVRSV